MRRIFWQLFKLRDRMNEEDSCLFSILFTIVLTSNSSRKVLKIFSRTIFECYDRLIPGVVLALNRSRTTPLLENSFLHCWKGERANWCSHYHVTSGRSTCEPRRATFEYQLHVGNILRSLSLGFGRCHRWHDNYGCSINCSSIRRRIFGASIY